MDEPKDITVAVRLGDALKGLADSEVIPPTEEDTATAPPGNARTQAIRSLHVDPAIQYLAVAAEKGGLVFGITLQVKGLIVSGFLASRKDYFNQMNARFMEIPGANKSEDFMASWTSWGDLVFPRDFEFDDVENLDAHTLTCIHLVDAFILSGSQRIPSSGTICWRAPIASIDSFFLGSLSVSRLGES